MTLIERAAQAAIECEQNMRGIDIGSPLWGRLIASAVLTAIREPSEGMEVERLLAAQEANEFICRSCFRRHDPPREPVAF